MTNLDVLQEDVKRMAAVMDPDYPTLPKVSKRKRKDETEGECMARVAQEEADRERVKGQWRQLEAMARTFLEEAFEIYEGKANFVVVGRLQYAPGLGYAKDASDRVAFGPFSTWGDAQEAVSQLIFSHTTGEEFKAWVTTYEQGTPAQWFRRRKMIREQAEDVPLTQAEKLIVKRLPDDCWRWGLSPDGRRIPRQETEATESAA